LPRLGSTLSVGAGYDSRRMSKLFLPVGLATLALWLAGCSPEDESLSGQDDDTAQDDADDAKDDSSESDTRGDDEAVNDAGSSSPPSTLPTATCPVPEFPQDDPPEPFAQLKARVVDQDGEGVPSVIAQVCGLDLCLFGETDPLGYIQHKESTELKRFAFKYGDGVRYAQFARLLTDGATYDLGDQTTVTFPAASESAAFEAGQVVSSGDFELDLTDTTAKIDVLSFPDDEQHVFVASELESERWPEAVPGDQRFEQLIALGPLKTKFCPPAALTWPNTAQLPAEAAVELLLHITDTANHWGAYGTFASVATAHVSNDGESITTDADSGLPELGVIGVRLAE
jgi:hypothetical protein